MSLISRGQAALVRTLAAAAGVTGGVTYSRPGGAALTAVPAWVGRTVFRQSGAHDTGAQVVFGERDYLIAVASLTAVAPPRQGDRVTEGAVVYEAQAPSSGEPVWRFSDQTRTVYRIHVKRVG